jgi:hypothetical protein
MSHIASGGSKLSWTDPDAMPWHRLLSSAAAAEHAAAVHTARLSDYFQATEREDLAVLYGQFSKEELRHEIAVLRTCEPTPLTTISRQVYGCERMRLHDTAWWHIELMSVVHLVFEPAALAYLSFLCKNAHAIFEQPWADIICQEFARIVSEESVHMSTGRQLIRDLTPSLGDDILATLKQSIATHRAFATFGVRRFFCNVPSQENHRTALLSRYANVFDFATRGCLQ